MGAPNDGRAFVSQAPGNNPAVGISGKESAVLMGETQGVNLRCMASQDVSWLSWREVLGGHMVLIFDHG